MNKDYSHQSLTDCHKICLSQNIPFASYRLPLQSEITTLIQHRSFPKKISSLENINKLKGFIVAPFSENKEDATYLLQADIHFSNNDIHTEVLQELKNTSLFLDINKKKEATIPTTKDDFTQQIEAIKKEISAENSDKIVLSKVHLETLEANFDASAFFLALCELYPHAFVSFIQLPEVGCWIGASPEPLAEIILESVQSVSLAGTQKAPLKENKDVIWNKKDINEQAIVTNYIEAILYNFKIADHKIQGPFSYKAGGLVHLKTVFSFNKTDLGNRLGAFIKAIHPTPSVCGLPKKTSLDFLLATEKHKRSYYAGYLGPINIAEETHLFVNLRCLQLFNQQVVIYSGAGITAASNAEKEWEETNQKMMTLLNVIKK